MNVISRHTINSNIVLHRSVNNEIVQSINYEEFCSMINFWKMFFVEEYNARAGQQAFIVGSPGYHYYGAIYAAMELGIVLILDWPHCYSDEDINSHKVKLFGTIDYMICTDYG